MAGLREDGRTVARAAIVKGTAINMIIAGLLSLAFMGFAGLFSASVFDDVEARMNEWRDDAPLAAVNRNAGVEPVEVPADLLGLMQRGIDIGEMTDGAFDITWAALWDLWDFNADALSVPGDEEIARRVELIDYRKIVIDEAAGTVFLPEEGMLIGVGGIAKGYALQIAAEKLAEAGIADYLITAGGQVMGRGDNYGKPWRVGIRDPFAPGSGHCAHIELVDETISTSGDYERYVEIDGVRYHHILDPRTGRPARNGLRSVSVVSSDPTLADALSTALFVMGAERALALVESFNDVDAVLIDDEGGVHVSLGLADRLVIDRPLEIPAAGDQP
jgi:thiamine biosynthesis lipoprotein